MSDSRGSKGRAREAEEHTSDRQVTHGTLRVSNFWAGELFGEGPLDLIYRNELGQDIDAGDLNTSPGRRPGDFSRGVDSRQTDGRAAEQTESQADKKTDRQTDQQTDTHRQRDRQTDRQTVRQT